MAAGNVQDECNGTTSVPCSDRRPAFVGQLKVGDYFVDSQLSTQVLFWLGLPAFWSKGPVR